MQSFDSLTGLYIFPFLNLDTNIIIGKAADDSMMRRMEMKKGNEKEEKLEENENDDACIIADCRRLNGDIE